MRNRSNEEIIELIGMMFPIVPVLLIFITVVISAANYNNYSAVDHTYTREGIVVSKSSTPDYELTVQRCNTTVNECDYEELDVTKSQYDAAHLGQRIIYSITDGKYGLHLKQLELKDTLDIFRTT